MKKFLLMFAAVAAIAFVGCKTETKPAEEVVEEQTEEVAPTVESVTADLLNCADEAQAVTLLDGLKAKAQALLDGGDQAGYFNIINIIKTVWEANKDAILAKIPTLAEKMTSYIDVPENLKAGFAEFVANAAKEKVNEAVEAQTEEVAPTVESVTADLLNCADEAQAVTLLDGLKAKAEELLNGGDQAGYFNIINILKTVWENNKDAILAKIPTLAEKMTNYIEVPENLKAGFTEFVANAAKEKVNEAVDAATDAAGTAVDAAKDKAGEAVDAAKDAAGNAVDAVKDKAADAAQKVANELKK